MLTPHTAVEVSEGADHHRSGARRLASATWRTECCLGQEQQPWCFQRHAVRQIRSCATSRRPLARHGTS
jgi:hypothetical protein